MREGEVLLILPPFSLRWWMKNSLGDTTWTKWSTRKAHCFSQRENGKNLWKSFRYGSNYIYVCFTSWVKTDKRSITYICFEVYRLSSICVYEQMPVVSKRWLNKRNNWRKLCIFPSPRQILHKILKVQIKYFVQWSFS